MIYVCILIIILLIITTILNIKRIKFIKHNKEEYIQQKKREYDQLLEFEAAQYSSALSKREQEEARLVERKKAIDDIISALEQKKEAIKSSTAQVVTLKNENIDTMLQAHFQAERARYEQELNSAYSELLEEAEHDFGAQMNEFTAQIEAAKAMIVDYQQKQAVINQEILRRKEIEEKQDYFKVNLQPEAIEDISQLMAIKSKLHSHENLDKLIYDVYINKPVLEMVKRVLKGEAPSGIYKITRLKTGEIYIGKSTDIKSRWQQHCKTAFGVGTIAHSILHTTMERDGLENFTFELLEEVPKDKLGEREKYWIEFYQSKQYGLNEKAGG